MRGVFVLGSRGMLGHVVARRLSERGYKVFSSSRRYAGEADSELIAEIVSSPSDTVVNCVGTTPGRASPSELLNTNGLLPQHLAARLGSDRLLVHASTDGVFAGTRGAYRTTDSPDASDSYGLSKRLGELAVHAGRVLVLRTSIIGPDLGAPRSLVSWLLCTRDRAEGYTDRMWNGITTLAWADLCVEAIEGRLGTGLEQPAIETPVSKCDLLKTIAAIYRHDVEIRPIASGSPIDRTLVPTLRMPAIRDQLEELRGWYGP
jgi:dTDP-4-dehydrorhamnose reductase